MNTQNGTTSADARASSIEHQLDALKADLKKLVHRFDSDPDGYVGKAKQQIQGHPLAAIGIAFGVGYLIMRLARSR